MFQGRNIFTCSTNCKYRYVIVNALHKGVKKDKDEDDDMMMMMMMIIIII